MMYRASAIRDVAVQVTHWRSVFREHHSEDPIFVMAQCFDDLDPRLYGFDGAVEFPPHKLTKSAKNISSSVKTYDNSFGARVFDYDELVDISFNEPRAEFPLIRTALPSWDNDARRQGEGMVVHASTPEAYERWLGGLIDDAERHRFFGEAVVCVNAWNEWCEGAYLEPDVHFGAAYLNATARAVSGLTRPFGKLLLVGHDAFPAGAQQLLLSIGLHLRRAFGFQIETVLLAGGELEKEYEAVGQVFRPTGKTHLQEILLAKLNSGFVSAIVNTCAAASVIPALKQVGIRTTLLVHEMPGILKEKALTEATRAGILAADSVIFPAEIVKRKVLHAVSVPDGLRFAIQPQGLYKNRIPDKKSILQVRSRLGLKDTSILVIGAGYADLRKGFDLFLASWKLARGKNADVHFCWLGKVEPQIADWFRPDIEAAEQTGSFHMLGYQNDPECYYGAADVFLLPSREDPFPSVALEALNAGLPIVAFEGTGGIPELITDINLGIVVSYGNVSALSEAIFKAATLRRGKNFAAYAQSVIRMRFSFDDYAQRLWNISSPDIPSLSVAVIAYNHARYLQERLQSIFMQDMPVKEIIVVDDASTDDSLDIITAAAEQADRYVSVFVNENRCGSPYLQWMRAVEASKGEFVWLAEGDDAAGRPFASRLLKLMNTDNSIVMCFSDSRSVDDQSNVVYESYKDYYATVEPGALSSDAIFEGPDFIRRFLLVKNLILNVSAAMWRREPLLRALKACEKDLKSLTISGDWRLYLECLSNDGSKIGYVADRLNVHRRHSSSLTGGLSLGAHLREIAAMHTFIERRFAVSKEVSAAQDAYREELRSRIS